MSALKIAKKVYRLIKDGNKKTLVDAGKHPHLKKGRVIKATDKESYNQIWNKGYKTGARKHRYEIADQLSEKGSSGGRYSNQVTKKQMNDASRRPLTKSKLNRTKKIKIQKKFRQNYPEYMDD